MGIAFTPSRAVVDLWGNGIGPIPDTYPGANIDLNPFMNAVQPSKAPARHQPPPQEIVTKRSQTV
jgi:hypothetical protein